MTDTIANLDTYQKTDTIEYDYQPKYSSVQSLLQILPVYNLHDKTDRESVMKLFSFQLSLFRDVNHSTHHRFIS